MSLVTRSGQFLFRKWCYSRPAGLKKERKKKKSPTPSYLPGQVHRPRVDSIQVERFGWLLLFCFFLFSPEYWNSLSGQETFMAVIEIFCPLSLTLLPCVHPFLSNQLDTYLGGSSHLAFRIATCYSRFCLKNFKCSIIACSAPGRVVGHDLFCPPTPPLSAVKRAVWAQGKHWLSRIRIVGAIRFTVNSQSRLWLICVSNGCHTLL